MTNKSKSSKKGFTLIELLVVIAIIAMLLAILMPALRKAKKVAQDVICRTNIKSMQLATLLYSDDYEGKMPMYKLDNLWVDAISAYLEDIDDARFCPATTIDKVAFDNKGKQYTWGASRKSWIWNYDLKGEPEAGSYGLNSWFYTFNNYPAAHADKYFKKMGNVNRLDMTPVFADSLWVDVGVKDTDTCPSDFNLDGNPNNGGRMSMHLLRRHGSHINVGFADGHQEVVELGALWSLKWYNDFQTQAWVTRDDGSPIYRKN